MAQKKAQIDGIGEVIVAKRRGTKHIRLSVTATGSIRVSVPYWLPYEAGLRFASSKKGWIAKQMQVHPTVLLEDGQRIGKAHHLQFVAGPKLRGVIKETVIQVVVPAGLSIADQQVQDRATSVCEKALRQEAEHLLPQRLQILAQKHTLNYRSVEVKKLRSRWGSCSERKNIVLSLYLMQLPWDLIDYVLLHELAHTVHMHHGAAFWQQMEDWLPNYKQLRKAVKAHKPRVVPT